MPVFADPLRCEIAVTEPGGPCACFDWDAAAGALRLTGVCRDIAVRPAHRGVVSATLGGDGLPVPALLVSDVRLPPGVRVEARLIGGLLAMAPGLPCPGFNGQEGVVLLQPDRLAYVGKRAGAAVDMHAFPIGAIAWIELRHSHLGSWFQAIVPGRRPADLRIPFEVAGERPFLRLVLLLRQLLGWPLVA